MKLLIIGANGFIGGNAVVFFADKGYEVDGCDVVVDDSLRERNIMLLSDSQPDFGRFFTDNSYDICLNASGLAHVGFSFDNPEKDFELNVLNVNKILVAIRKFNPKCKFINFSSAAVYGNPVKLPIAEDADTKPLSPYGFHKLQSEYLLKEYSKFFGLHTCSLRVFSAFGPRLKKQLFWDMYQKSLQSSQIELFGTGEESRDFIFIEDLLEAVELVIKHGNFEGEVINVASGTEITIKEAAEIFYGLLNPGISFSFTGKIKMGDPNNWKADITLLQKMGFVAKWDLKNGLRRNVQWIKENG